MLDNKQDLLEDIKNKVTSDFIIVGLWKHVPIELKGRKKMAMKIIDTKMTQNEFFVHVNMQVEEFSEHVSWIKTQY